MTREIKFRAWDKLGKRMIDNGYYSFIFLNGQITGVVDVIDGTRTNFIAPKIVVMPFTGQFDKHKWPIFEGDIVRFNAFTEHGNSGKTTGQILWNEDECAWSIFAKHCEFGLGTKNGLFMSWAKNIDIIGNVYENPELLEVQKYE